MAPETHPQLSSVTGISRSFNEAGARWPRKPQRTGIGIRRMISLQ